MLAGLLLGWLWYCATLCYNFTPSTAQWSSAAALLGWGHCSSDSQPSATATAKPTTEERSVGCVVVRRAAELLRCVVLLLLIQNFNWLVNQLRVAAGVPDTWRLHWHTSHTHLIPGRGALWGTLGHFGARSHGLNSNKIIICYLQ